MLYKKWMLMVLFVSLAGSCPSLVAKAAEDKPTILFIYASEDATLNEDIHMLDATFSAFSSNQKVVSVQSFNKDLLNDVDVLVFVGDTEVELPPMMVREIDNFEGKFILIGYNGEQFETFDEWQFGEDMEIGALNDRSLAISISLINVVPPKESEVLSTGTSLNGTVPYIVVKGRLTYISSPELNRDQKYILSQMIYQLLDIKKPNAHPAYIRLEDISPVSNHELVKETGEYLADRGIPFYMAIIPVYVNNETGDKIYMKSNHKLVEVLRYLQSRGGIVIGHGYTHSYRYEETGEGFEFWDDQLNQKITTVRTDRLPEPLPTREVFRSDNAYQEFIDKIDQIEKGYIENKHRKAIEELTDLELYPLAFEAPHYTMSSTGYAITSNYFTSIFGQIQLSDDDWEVMDTPLFVAKPKILSGMTVYPETIGYANPESTDPLEVARESVIRLKEVPGSVVGGFYHPYLGMEFLEEMLELIYSVGTIEWIDLRKEEQMVKTNQVLIHQQENGVLKVQSDRNTWKRLLEFIKGNPLETTLWGVSAIVLIFIVSFFIYIVNLRAGLKKRLFKERANNG